MRIYLRFYIGLIIGSWYILRRRATPNELLYNKMDLVTITANKESMFD